MYNHMFVVTSLPTFSADPIQGPWGADTDGFRSAFYIPCLIYLEHIRNLQWVFDEEINEHISSWGYACNQLSSTRTQPGLRRLLWALSVPGTSWRDSRASKVPSRILSMGPGVPESTRSYLITILYNAPLSACHSGNVGTNEIQWFLMILSEGSHMEGTILVFVD